MFGALIYDRRLFLSKTTYLQIKRKLEGNNLMEKFCQSCAIPLNTKNLGSEQDGSTSMMYCELCYQNGAFTNSEISFAEMLAVGKAGIDQSSSNFITKFMLKALYPASLKRITRFKNAH